MRLHGLVEAATAGLVRHVRFVAGAAPVPTVVYQRATAVLDPAADDEAMNALLASFYIPLAALRDQVPGGAVSLVKAGAVLHGLAMGPVRPPLLSATEDHMVALAGILWEGMTTLEKLP